MILTEPKMIDTHIKRLIEKYIKKFILMIIFLSLFIYDVSAELRIGSFNTHFLGCNSCKDMHKFSELIKTEDFSIIALQEVLKAQRVGGVVDYLGKGWEYVVSEPVGRNRKEYYAFGGPIKKSH